MILSKLLMLLLSVSSYAYDITSIIRVDNKYEQAFKTTSVAIYKQSGLESKVNQVNDASQAKGNTWLKVHNLMPIASVVGTIGAAVITKQIQFHSKDFVITGTMDKKEIDWKFSF